MKSVLQIPLTHRTGDRFITTNMNYHTTPETNHFRQPRNSANRVNFRN